jgi:hypothetical protein
MMFDFGALGKGTTIHHLTPEEPMLMRSRFVMYASSRMPQIMANIFLLSESAQVQALAIGNYMITLTVRARRVCLEQQEVL